MEDTFRVSELIAAEEELQQLKEKYGETEKEPLWKRLITSYAEKKANRVPKEIAKKKYCLTAFFGGWLGIHCFMTGKKGQGILYLLLSFTGISFLMSILDIWYALFLQTDENGKIKI